MSMVGPGVSGLPLFGTAPSEPEKGATAVAELASDPMRASYLRVIRDRMRMIYRTRVRAYGADSQRAVVRPDDAREIFERECNAPADMSRNFLGAVFRERGWVRVGEYRSETKGSHGNDLNEYRWKG